MELTLRGVVLSHYRNISQFAKAIGWERGKASRIVNGQQQPSKVDMEKMIDLLGISQDAVAPLFFGKMFTM